jgi:hypothetical protein
MEIPDKIEKGGWHLSYFGNVNFIKNKLMNFAHQEYNTSYFTDLSSIDIAIRENRNLFDRNEKVYRIELCDNKYLPIDYAKYLTYDSELFPI